jgi:hypothetical protein
MSKISLIFALCLLGGCATPPQFLAKMYDDADPCQQWRDKSRPLGDQIPSWCGAGTGTNSVVTRDYYTGRYIYRTK